MTLDLEKDTVKHILDTDPAFVKEQFIAMQDRPGHRFFKNEEIPDWVPEFIDQLKEKGEMELQAFAHPKYSMTAKKKLYQYDGFTEHNTKYWRYDSDGETSKLDKWFDYLAKDVCGLKEHRTKINVQPPGNFFPQHCDMMNNFTRIYPEKSAKIKFPDTKRYTMFLTDQEVGHFYATGSGCVEWNRGDIIEQAYYTFHGTGNAGTKDKICVVIEGVEFDI